MIWALCARRWSATAEKEERLRSDESDNNLIRCRTLGILGTSTNGCSRLTYLCVLVIYQWRWNGETDACVWFLFLGRQSVCHRQSLQPRMDCYRCSRYKNGFNNAPIHSLEHTGPPKGLSRVLRLGAKI